MQACLQSIGPMVAAHGAPPARGNIVTRVSQSANVLAEGVSEMVRTTLQNISSTVARAAEEMARSSDSEQQSGGEEEEFSSRGVDASQVAVGWEDALGHNSDDESD
jgi:hypothetical protein